jgi:hypothetical protein
MTLRNVLLPGLTLVRRGRVVALLVLLYLLPERIIPLTLFRGISLSHFENGRRLCCGSGGLLGFVLLVRHSPADGGESCEDRQQDQFQQGLLVYGR